MLTAEEIERVVAACAGAGCPALLAISVIGRVELLPADPLDAAVVAAYNAHQRRTVEGRGPLGPHALDATADAFRRYGADVRLADSPWRLDAGHGELIAQWLRGWLDAAREQDPEMAAPLDRYAIRRLAQAATERLSVVVWHRDLLALPAVGAAGST
jgi:hypothetical protein